MKPLVIVLIVVASVVVLGAAAFFLMFRGPDLRPYLALKEPRIVRKDDARVLQVTFAGQKTDVIQPAFGLLMRTYFGLKDVPKGPGMGVPRARYAFPENAPRDPAEAFKSFQAGAWTGAAAIPVPAAATLAPQGADARGLKAEIATWSYGEVAEILHLGPYETEIPTVQRLAGYVASQGYEIAGDHEEEYLKGPGMPFVSPKDYWTILRYQVRKKK
jgi:hypothetical protein